MMGMQPTDACRHRLHYLPVGLSAGGPIQLITCPAHVVYACITRAKLGEASPGYIGVIDPSDSHRQVRRSPQWWRHQWPQTKSDLALSVGQKTNVAMAMTCSDALGDADAGRPLLALLTPDRLEIAIGRQHAIPLGRWSLDILACAYGIVLSYRSPKQCARDWWVLVCLWSVKAGWCCSQSCFTITPIYWAILSLRRSSCRDKGRSGNNLESGYTTAWGALSFRAPMCVPFRGWLSV